MPAPPVKVTLVTDSAPLQQFVAQTLAGQAIVQRIAAAANPLLIERLRRQWPQVVLLDMEAEGVDAPSFVRQVLAEGETGILLCAPLAERSLPATLAAIAAGAVGSVKRPASAAPPTPEQASALLRAVRTAADKAAAKGRPLAAPAQTGSMPSSDLLRAKNSADVMLAAGPATVVAHSTQPLIAIGASTGGTQALEFVLTRLPPTCAGIVIVQHMPARFTTMLAQRLNELCRIEVREACHGDQVRQGRALIAPGNRHMLIRRSGTQYLVDVADGPLVNRHRPSVDVLFRSVARFAGGNALGVIMTGMGDDGARSLREMRDAGARTIAQDEASCIVFGMPKEAIRHGGVEQVMGLEQIPSALLTFARGSSRPGLT